MSALPAPARSDTPAIKELRRLESLGLMRVTQRGKAWNIQSRDVDLLVAGLSWLHPSDFGTYLRPGRL